MSATSMSSSSWIWRWKGTILSPVQTASMSIVGLSSAEGLQVSDGGSGTVLRSALGVIRRLLIHLHQTQRGRVEQLVTPSATSTLTLPQEGCGQRHEEGNMTLQELIDWQKADKGDRYVKVDLTPSSNPSIWVYSARLQEGMHVMVDQSIADINLWIKELGHYLEDRNVATERAQYEILKQKYGGE